MKKGECFFCRVEQPLNALQGASFEEIRGGENVLTCDSCMNVPGLVQRFLEYPLGQMLLMVNTKLDMLLRKR